MSAAGAAAQLEDAVAYEESGDSGTPGGSAPGVERRRAAREERIQAKHPKIGGLILALSDEPQSTRAWDTGAVGEERVTPPGV